MLWIAVTPPAFHDGEAAFISRLLAGGVDVVHLRKPGSAEAECAGLLEALSEDERARVVVHDHFGLAARYGLMGIHLNSRNPSVPEGFRGQLSRSCHSLEEVRRFKPECGYVFLSPVFDSISKQGYSSAFSAPSAASPRRGCRICGASVSAEPRCWAASVPLPPCPKSARRPRSRRYAVRSSRNSLLLSAILSTHLCFAVLCCVRGICLRET